MLADLRIYDSGWEQGDNLEARAIIQTTEDGDLGHGGGREVGERRLDPGCILKVEPAGLADMGCERKREKSKMFPRLLT